MQKQRGGPSAPVLAACLIGIAVGLAACRTAARSYIEPDSRAVLQAHLSHGLGESPFDSPLVRDSLAAAVVLATRDCAAVSSLQVRFGSADGDVRIFHQLEEAGLIERRGARFCAAFPIVIGDRQERYARITADLADMAYDEIAADLATLLDDIRERGWEHWGYHFVWSQLFDSQFAWAEMVTRELVPPLAPVEAWVIYPPHPYRSGTNYYPDAELRDYWLMVSWRAGGANTTDPVGKVWDLLYRAGIEGQPLDERGRNELRQLGMLDEGGSIEFPVIREGDPLHTGLKAAARRYVEYLANHLPYEALVEITGTNRQKAFAMAYHDVSWGIVDRLHGYSMIHVPTGLAASHDEGRPSMRGVFAAAPVYPPFVELVLAALEAR
jgi:hypothetical protein